MRNIYSALKYLAHGTHAQAAAARATRVIKLRDGALTSDSAHLQPRVA
jgi:predicted ABC-type transport system involved in lysophospholipase L1 biosynthesis ATPase subunit